MGMKLGREEPRLRVFENRVLRKTFGPKRDEVTRDWRKLHNEELHNLYSSPSIIRMIKSRRMRWAGHVACMREARNACRILVGKPEGKNHWEDQDVCVCVESIKVEIGQIGWDGVDWIGMAQDWRALVNTVMSLKFHKMLENS
jgi:hypothetical protein